MSLSQTTSGAGSNSRKTWEDAAAPASADLAQRYEDEWHQGLKPDLDAFLALAGHSPGARLALLRIDLGLRWESKNRVGVDWYRKRYSDLPQETLVALIYEEFCLREDGNEKPDPGEYLRRHPELAVPLRRVLDIHGLIGHGGNSTFRGQAQDHADFPKAGETIAGFRLVEELGRGAFARVFRAEERQLADRPVALKVARSGSREPQTLARLQHTHIVPVYSYRTDPATGLHVLCMPYFGRLTLAQVLADPKLATARSGADIVEVLDRLGDVRPVARGRSTGRASLLRRRYSQSIAWWGARMAEALEHAHDRGVLHRDVKPSNVLITTDGMPMLLDFNLARAKSHNDSENDRGLPGGTLDYMSPEHLEELADGFSEHVDARSDVYGMGVLLFEALTCSRPFGAPKGASSPSELLLIAAGHRRDGPPSIRDRRPDVSSALESVVLRCLEPDPAKRYATAADLAADLQAVADDRPLRHASEPWVDRSFRWIRRNRKLLAAALPILFGVVMVLAFLLREQFNRHQIWSEVQQLYEAAMKAEAAHDYGEARDQFELAALLAAQNESSGLLSFSRQFGAAEDKSYASSNLSELRELARQGARRTENIQRIRGDAEAVTKAADSLRFRLSGFDHDLKAASDELQEVLAPFFVFDKPFWLSRPDLRDLSPEAYARLRREVNELTFLWTVALLRSGEEADLNKALANCDRALSFCRPNGPWLALRDLIKNAMRRPLDPIKVDPLDETDDNALGACQWGMVRSLQGRRPESLRELRKAVRMEPHRYWYHFILARKLDEQPEDHGEAFRHYEVALALDPDSPWLRFARLKAAFEQNVGPDRMRAALTLAFDAKLSPKPLVFVREVLKAWSYLALPSSGAKS